MSIGKLCGMAVIVVIIAPLILGMVWPTGTETKDVYEVDPAMDLTDGLATREIPIYDAYRGPLNNLSEFSVRDGELFLGYPTPWSTTQNPNSYPYVRPDAAEEPEDVITSVTILDMARSGKSRWTLTGPLEYSGDEGTYEYADYWPATNALLLYSTQEPPKRVTPVSTDTLTATGREILAVSYGTPAAWIQTAGGMRPHIASPGIWTNGMDNKSVTMWVSLRAAPTGPYIEVEGVRLSMDSAGLVTVTSGEQSEFIGSAYRFFELQITPGSMKVTGLIGVDDFDDMAYNWGNSVTMSYDTDYPDGVPYVMIQGTDYTAWWVKSTESAIGTATGIRDAGIVPDAYWPSHAWQLQLINPSTFGDQIRIGSLTLPVNADGTVTVTSLDDGERSDQPIRSMHILSLVLDGQQEIYVNGVRVLEQSPAAVTVSLDGDWYVSVVLSKVTQETQTEYTWKVGSFGFDQAAFCLAGLMSCVAVAIGGTIWGRRSGERVLALQITMILAGAAYLVMM